jgi:hypothetical protein
MSFFKNTTQFYFLHSKNILFHSQTSSVEIERVCNRADGNVLETAAVTIKSRTGGPEQLVILAVLKDKSAQHDIDLLKRKFQKAIQTNLNPLFKVQMNYVRLSSTHFIKFYHFIYFAPMLALLPYNYQIHSTSQFSQIQMFIEHM